MIDLEICAATLVLRTSQVSDKHSNQELSDEHKKKKKLEKHMSQHKARLEWE